QLQTMLGKIISYQDKPVKNQFNKPLLAGEELDPATQVLEGDALDMLIGRKTDFGFETNGIPATDNITKLYDTRTSSWSGSQLITKINAGPSAIYHIGHSDAVTNMRLSINDVTDNNFSKLNGTTNNFTIVNTIGCICGAFDQECIGEQMIKIRNFAVAFIGNSRYGWFDNGTKDGPSNRIQRLYVHGLYTEKLLRIGTALMYGKVKFSPFIDAAGEFEPGARRWCYYCNNLLGDPAMVVWISNDQTGLFTNGPDIQMENHASLTYSMNKTLCSIHFTLAQTSEAAISVLNSRGQLISTLSHGTRKAGQSTIVWNTASLVPGAYFIQLQTERHRETACLTLVR
ncbi:MAG: hypothetical protein JW795_12835, partial [Chitinivibrionales bacterium]|nr:hypothetical protein [Chitinivibrionales bacterium]